MSELSDKLLAKPVGPKLPARSTDPDKVFTSKIELEGNSLSVVINDKAGTVTQGTARDFLCEEGQDPDAWEVTGMKKSKYGRDMESVKFSYKRKLAVDLGDMVDIDSIVKRVKRHRASAKRSEGSYGAIVALGDMQFGKMDGDGYEGTLQRTIEGLDKAADRIVAQRRSFDIGHIHVAWLGDHIEGFVSQRGASAWRTPLSLSDQMRLVTEVMYHAAETFAPLCARVSMAAVPGNHGEPQRFAGKGVTTYDDSHDTASLLAVQRGLSYNPDAFGHVEFYVPANDELTVVVDVAGTVVAHAHGHQWSPGRHFAWWRGQAFHAEGAQQANLLLSGHLHHLLVEKDGPRTFLQVPALEAESTWWRHRQGSIGDPGMILAITKDGRTDVMEMVR